MSRSFLGRRDRYRDRRRGPRSRAAGCLLWVLLLIVILIVLSLMFGGFRKGTKAALSLPVGNTVCHSAGHGHL